MLNVSLPWDGRKGKREETKVNNLAVCAEKRYGTGIVQNDGESTVFPCIRREKLGEPTVE